MDDGPPVLGSMAAKVTVRSAFKTPQSPPVPQRRSVQMLTFGADWVVRVVCTFWTTNARDGWTVAGMVTLAGTWTLLGSELSRLTNSPPVGAGESRLMLASARCMPTPSAPTLM